MAGLLAHYWTGNDDRATRRAQILDWVSDLQEFPLGAIEGAIITWRRNNRNRPTPADIRKLIVPDPEPLIEAGAAYQPGHKSRLTLHQLAKHRQAIAPIWDLVRRAKAGEDAELLIAERKRLSAAMFARDPELERINAIIVEEEEQERRS